MKLETAKTNIGCYFTIRGRQCKVISVKSFRGTLHYFFITDDQIGNQITGWITVELVGQCEW